MSRERNTAGVLAAGAIVLGAWWVLSEAPLDVALAPGTEPEENTSTSARLAVTATGEVRPPVAEVVPRPEPTPETDDEAWPPLTGRVTDRDGRPIERASVVATMGGAWEGMREETLTDEDGRYALRDPSAWSGSVLALADGFVSELDSLPLDRLRDEDLTLDFSLQHGVVASGRVLWEDGRPCAGARVELLHPAALRSRVSYAFSTRPEPIETTLTGEDGRFDVSKAARAQLVTLRVTPAEYALPGRLFPCHVGSDGLEPPTFALAFPADLSVTVIVPPDADVDLWGTRLRLSTEGDWHVPTLPAELHDRRALLQGIDPQGTHTLRINVPGHDPFATLASNVVLTSGSNSLEVHLPELERLARWPPRTDSWSFFWTLVSMDGLPIPVTDLFSLGLMDAGRGPFLLATALSLADGSIQELQLGLSHFRSRRFAYLNIPPPVRLELRLGSETLTAELSADSGSVARFVLDMDEWTKRLAQIRVRAVDTRGRPVRVERVLIQTGTEAGHWVLPGPEGHVDLWAAEGGHDLLIVTPLVPPALHRFDVTSIYPQEKLFTIHAPGAVVGSVIDGAVWRCAQLHRWGAVDPFGAVRTSVDRQGRFSFPAIDPGQYTVSVVAADGSVSRAPAPVVVEPDRVARCVVAGKAASTRVSFRYRMPDGGWLWVLGADGETIFDRRLGRSGSLTLRLPHGRNAYRLAAMGARTIPPLVPLTCGADDLEIVLGE